MRIGDTEVSAAVSLIIKMSGKFKAVLGEGEKYGDIRDDCQVADSDWI